MDLKGEDKNVNHWLFSKGRKWRIDSTFPREGRTVDITGTIVSDWSRIPTELELLRAIKYGIKKKEKRV